MTVITHIRWYSTVTENQSKLMEMELQSPQHLTKYGKNESISAERLSGFTKEEGSDCVLHHKQEQQPADAHLWSSH